MQERARKDMEILSSMFYEDRSQNEIKHKDNKKNNKAIETSNKERDKILEKIKRCGYDSLTHEEKRKLFH